MRLLILDQFSDAGGAQQMLMELLPATEVEKPPTFALIMMGITKSTMVILEMIMVGMSTPKPLEETELSSPPSKPEQLLLVLMMPSLMTKS